MGSTTPVLALPYPVGTDLLADGDNSIKSLAERVETLMVGTWAAIPGFTGAAQTGFKTVAFRKVGDVVEVRGVANWTGGITGGTTIGTLPAGSRPLTLGEMFAVYANGGAWHRLDINTTGALVIQTTVAAGSILTFSTVRFSTAA